MLNKKNVRQDLESIDYITVTSFPSLILTCYQQVAILSSVNFLDIA